MKVEITEKRIESLEAILWDTNRRMDSWRTIEDLLACFNTKSITVHDGWLGQEFVDIVSARQSCFTKINKMIEKYHVWADHVLAAQAKEDAGPSQELLGEITKAAYQGRYPKVHRSDALGDVTIPE